MEFSHVIRDNILIVTPQGESLNAMTAPFFKEKALDLIHREGLTKVIFDLSQLRFIDSSGLGAFLSIQRTLNKQGGLLKLAHLNQSIQTMFEIVSMHRIFDIFPTVEDAVKSF
jgi:anti-anti-sigma factor